MEILNIVASYKFPFKFNLDQIEGHYPNICSRPLHFPSVNLKLDCSDLGQVFSNGNLIVLGGTTIEQTSRLFKKYSILLSDLGYKCSGCEQFKIVNIVARYSNERAINLFDLATRTKFEYEPELFPAVRYRLKDLKITINIFRTGNCIILGAKFIEDLQEAEERLTELLNGTRSS